MITFGKRVVTLRKVLELSQQDLAVLVGVGWATVSRWEREGDEPSSPTESVIYALEMIVQRGRGKALLQAFRSGAFAGGTPAGYNFIFSCAFDRLKAGERR